MQMLQEDNCSIESLSLVDSKLRSETSLVLNALGSNHSLINIDVSGNMMGLVGAKTLAKALQINNRLETIYWDRNLTPTSGFIDIAFSLERNYSLKHMPVPLQDVQQAMMKMADRTEAAVNKIQEFIRRNNLPQTTLMRNLRLHGVNSSNLVVDDSLFASVERAASQLQQALRNRPLDASDRIPSVDSIDISLNNEHDNTISVDDHSKSAARAEILLQDVHNVKHLCTKMQQLYSQTHGSDQTSTCNSDSFSKQLSSYSSSRPIEVHIVKFAKELRRTFETQITSISEQMIQFVKEEFPHVFMFNRKLESELKDMYVNSLIGTNCKPALIPSIDYFHMCLTENTGGTSWSVKLEQILNTIASQICSRVLVEISRYLKAMHKSLTDSFDSKSTDFSNSSQTIHLNGLSLTPDVLRNRVFDSSSSHDSTDLNLLNPNENVLNVDGNNSIVSCLTSISLLFYLCFLVFH